jgi:predicted  nucleic acid-binding Zn-ribbon protein
MSEQLEQIKHDIESHEVLSADKISVELIENKGTQQSKLIFNEDPNFSIKLENREYKFKLVEPIYIDKIQLKAKTILKDVVISYHTVKDENKTIKINIDKSIYISSSIKNTIDSISILSPKNKKVELEKIEFFGFRLSQFKNIEENLKALEKLNSEMKEEIKKVTSYNQTQLDEIENKTLLLEKLHTELDNDVKSLTSQREELEQETENLNIEIKQLSETKNNLENTKKDLITKEQELKNSIQEREKTLSTVNTDIATKREELKKLDNETSLIAYDMQEYVRNAKKDIKWYIGLSIIPWLLIACMSYILVYGGAYLTTILKVENDAQLWTIFWSRIPFVLAVSSVMFVAYEVSNIFIRKIMEINQQILDFAKIGIIAKDVSETSSINLDLTDEEKFELRTKLKMDMLKSHLSKDLGKKFEINIKPKIWNKWLNLNDKSVDKDAKDTLDEE